MSGRICAADAPFSSGRLRSTYCIVRGPHAVHEAVDGSRWDVPHEEFEGVSAGWEEQG